MTPSVFYGSTGHVICTETTETSGWTDRDLEGGRRARFQCSIPTFVSKDRESPQTIVTAGNFPVLPLLLSWLIKFAHTLWSSWSTELYLYRYFTNNKQDVWFTVRLIVSNCTVTRGYKHIKETRHLQLNTLEYSITIMACSLCYCLYIFNSWMLIVGDLL